VGERLFYNNKFWLITEFYYHRGFNYFVINARNCDDNNNLIGIFYDRSTKSSSATEILIPSEKLINY
jgi:hypothetical protein